jgi:hypothetical protein
VGNTPGSKPIDLQLEPEALTLHEGAAPQRPSLYGRIRKLKPTGDLGG